MNWIKKWKYNLIGISFVIVLFILSVQIRSDNLKAPLSRHHEWITAHSLITVEIWENNGGPSAYNFSPVYSYKGKGNIDKKMLGGIQSKEKDSYYVSYPPFSFIFLYYTSQILGGSSVDNVRIVSLFIHFISALLIYLLIGLVRSKSREEKINFAGIIAAGLYIFSQGNLWFHGNLYFVDMVVQPFFIGGVYLSIRYIKGKYKNETIFLGLLFLVFFLAAYTEWLGLFSAFYTSLFFFIIAIVKKQKKYIRPFISIAIGASLALGLTLYQYTSIDGWDTLKTTSEKKYDVRSGRSNQGNENILTIHDDKSYEMLFSYFNQNYKDLKKFSTISFYVFLLLFILKLSVRNSKKIDLSSLKWKGLLLLLFLLPILTHYLLFFNFNALHDFSGLKAATLIIVLIALFIQMIIQFANSFHSYVFWSVIVFFSVFFIVNSVIVTKRYLENNSLDLINWNQHEYALKIAEISGSDIAVITTTISRPEQVYYAKHNIIYLPEIDTGTVFNILLWNKSPKAHYYQLDAASKLKSIMVIDKVGDELFFKDSLFFN